MTPEVRDRIEQIRHGNVPEGYLKDKDGVHPSDWTAKKMGQWLKLAERPVTLEDDETYQLVTVRRGFGGVDSRGYFLGKNVLVKNYFSVFSFKRFSTIFSVSLTLQELSHTFLRASSCFPSSGNFKSARA